MSIFAAALVSLGIIILGVGLVFAHKICHITEKRGWKLLSGLIVGFVIGYSLFLDALLVLDDIDSLVVGVSLILFFGSIFVVTVLRFGLASITELNQKAIEEHYNARHDLLTGLPNRSYCLQEMSSRIEQGKPFTVLMFDVVNFKQVNDALGHHCGDQLLFQLGQRICKLTKSDELLTRLGGDEFVVITNRNSQFELNQLVSYIELALKELFIVEQFEVSTSVVFGSSRYPSDAKDTTQLLNFADISMYQAKSQGLSLVSYKPAMIEGAKHNLSIASQIQHALDDGQFKLYYQPIVCPHSERVVEFEALIRWQTETGEFISPAQFIPIAEQSNKITDITLWVIKQVFEDLERFHAQNIAAPIHVNLSAKDIIGGKVFKLLAQASAANPNITRSIVIEITETAAIRDIPNSQSRLERIKQLGYRISLDDFGTGYSSLARLSELPIDQIKIDRSFIQDITDNAKSRTIVETSIDLAHGLKFDVVVEGVENRETLETLMTMKCDLIQGYLYSAPKPLPSIITWTQQFHSSDKLPLVY
ncbi:diguanylate cyclase [Vibrio fortis]|uniref:Diguanylate cyclase n=1 Tax=Vibrio fortis TaxID=212667 RepID=A0A066UTQ3_9VIBR|nr:bifunctional diguanylate cyclase/phosphodiesterase [Vibrio fortis]KDN27514.1 diguanylate cyclase [Vibrio fortis]